jgi:hypothetical protein
VAAALLRTSSLVVVLSFAPALDVAAQAPVSPSGVRLGSAGRQEQLGPHHVRWSEAAEVELVSEQIRFSADVIDYYEDAHRLTAEGHVVFVGTSGRISAERAEFDTAARTGTFFEAYGSATVPGTVDRSFFGDQRPDAFFYGETIEKLGPLTYRIRKGGFTTCLQPTPRWEITARSVTLTVDRRALLTSAVLKVKDVPLFYVPAMFYPINKEDRSTGFLLPVYGSSTSRGRSVGNAFFWAINRSQDLTITHDWFTRAGQGYGAEYRYAAAAASGGQLRVDRLDQHAYTVTQGGQSYTQAPIDSVAIRGRLTQALPGGFRARANADYVTDMLSQRLYATDVFASTSASRSYDAGVSGPLGRGTTVGVSVAEQETFSTIGTSATTGGRPRVQLTRALTRLGRTPLYAAATAEYARLAWWTTSNGVRSDDRSLSRADVSPTVQLPLTAWPFLSGRASVTWHTTWWSESRDAGRLQVDTPLMRNYAEMRVSLTGPILARVWDTPGSALGERLKHVIEPELTVQRTTAIDDRARIVPIDRGDYPVGGTTTVTYGLTNRLLVRRRGVAVAGAAAAARTRELLTVQLQQSWYSNPLASTVDGRYTGAYTDQPAGAFSAASLAARIDPTDAVGGSLRLEYRPEGDWASIQASGSVKAGTWLQTSGGWSRRRYVQSVLQPAQPALDDYVNWRTSVSAGRSHVGGAYQLDLPLSGASRTGHRAGVFYNAQCCGAGVDWQQTIVPASGSVPAHPDRRFTISFTLAGVGSFSNVLGVFGIGQGETSGTRRF